MGETLSEQVKSVRLSSRLTSSPACVVGDVFDFTPMLEKMYRSAGQELPVTKRTLELNPKHPLVTGLRDAVAANKEDAALADTAAAHLRHGRARGRR